MQWQGKVVGALIGLIAGPAGALLGAVLGHGYDLAREQPGGDPREIGAALFATAFAVMGNLAKSDGRVSEQEIDAARRLMRQMQLGPDQVALAVESYTRGKAPGYPLAAELARLRALCGPRRDLLRMFLELELRAALLGNELVAPVRTRLMAIGQALGFSALEFAGLETLVRLQTGWPGAAGAGPASGGVRVAALQAAYEVLGLAPSATDEEVKKAYRRQMNDNHPDKLMARGLPESMQELAKEKTQRIREAYEAILAKRNRH